jgi:hypothetical protein
MRPSAVLQRGTDRTRTGVAEEVDILVLDLEMQNDRRSQEKYEKLVNRDVGNKWRWSFKMTSSINNQRARLYSGGCRSNLPGYLTF